MSPSTVANIILPLTTSSLLFFINASLIMANDFCTVSAEAISCGKNTIPFSNLTPTLFKAGIMLSFTIDKGSISLSNSVVLISASLFNPFSMISFREYSLELEVFFPATFWVFPYFST